MNFQFQFFEWRIFVSADRRLPVVTMEQKNKSGDLLRFFFQCTEGQQYVDWEVFTKSGKHFKDSDPIYADYDLDFNESERDIATQIIKDWLPRMEERFIEEGRCMYDQFRWAHEELGVDTQFINSNVNAYTDVYLKAIELDELSDNADDNLDDIKSEYSSWLFKSFS